MFKVESLKENYEDYLRYKQVEKELEMAGDFNADVDGVTYDGTLPVTENYPYIKRGVKARCKAFVCNRIALNTSKKVAKKLINLKIKGKNNLNSIKSAIVTCNHISKVDFFPIKKVLKNKLMFVGADFNNWDNVLGKVARNAGYIPLPVNLNLRVMRKFDEAVSFYLKKGKNILIYPEQSMWREDARPRPLKKGAFYYAVKNDVPIMPMFITMQPKKVMAENGKRNFSDYTLHILPPIYADKNLTQQENVNHLMESNYEMWKTLYEQTYNKTLKFNTKKP